MKRFAFAFLYALGIPALFRFWHRNALTIVLYHGVAPGSVQGIYNYRGKFISPESFSKQIEYLRAHYTILSLDRALQMLRENSLPPYSLVITFDDGYKNFKEYAYPVLSRHNIPATIFIATDFVTRNIPLWVDRLEYAIGHGDGSRVEKIQTDSQTRDRFKALSAQQREHDLRNVEQISWIKFDDFSGDRAVYAPLTREDLISLQLREVSFGAHTQSHPILSKQTVQEQQEEILGSRSDLSSMSIRVSPTFAYPNGQPGDWNHDTERILAESGFMHALTTIEGVNTARTAPYRLRRMVLDNTESFPLFANVVSGVRSLLKSIMTR